MHPGEKAGLRGFPPQTPDHAPIGQEAAFPAWPVSILSNSPLSGETTTNHGRLHFLLLLDCAGQQNTALFLPSALLNGRIYWGPCRRSPSPCYYVCTPRRLQCEAVQTNSDECHHTCHFCTSKLRLIILGLKIESCHHINSRKPFFWLPSNIGLTY